jgi:hypothetical protein
MASNGRRAHGDSSFLGSVADRLLARPWIVLAAALVVQTALFFAIQRDLSTADPLYYARYAHDRVVLVCGDFRCPMFTDLHFGFASPANLVVVAAPDFAIAPPPEHARVRLLVQLVRSGGVGKDVARRAEELGLRRILWHPDVRLYDADDGARLREALAKP